MKDFEYYLNGRDVKRCAKNMPLAKSLIKAMHARLRETLEEDENKKPITIFCSIYDSLREFCDAVLAINGYKSYSHEASISYLAKKGFDVVEVQKLDGFRYARNGSKYYGKVITPEDAKNIRMFYLQIRGKINELIKENGLNG